MVIYNIPYEGNCKVPGASLGPIEVTKKFMFEKNSFKPIHKIENLFCFNDNIKNCEILESIKCCLMDKEQIIILGGSHRTTAYVIKEILKLESQFSIVIFDAHNDYSIAPSILETNWNILNDIIPLVKEGLIIGFRDLNDLMPPCNKFDYIKDCLPFNYKLIEKKIKTVCLNNEYIYLSIDLDVLNPIEFPGTGYKCAGGLSLRELLYCLNLIKKNAQYLIVDIVEFNPLIEKEQSLLVIERIIKNFF